LFHLELAFSGHIGNIVARHYHDPLEKQVVYKDYACIKINIKNKKDLLLKLLSS